TLIALCSILFLLSIECIGSIPSYSLSTQKNIDIGQNKLHSKDTARLYDTEKTSSGSIMAGSAAQSITPDLSTHSPIYIAGFGRNRVATGIHDDLWSRCCCVQIGNVTTAFVSVDLIGVMYPEYQRIVSNLDETTSIDLVVLTSTHNHEGPDVIGLWGKAIWSGITWNWYNEALTIITDTINDAYENMQPAGIKLAHTMASNMSRDSRKPIVMEEQVETIQLVDYDKQPIATMICYASHPEILWDENTLITADYPHYMYEHIEETLGGTALLLTGPIGGLITPKTRNHTFESAKKFGEIIADLSIESLNNTSIIWETEIRIQTKELFIPLTNPVFRIASILNILDRPLYHFRKDVKTSVNVIELGNDADLLQLVTVPGEDFPENWFELKEKMHAKHRVHIGLATDELGYIVRIEDYDPTDYEESMSASKQLDPLVHQALEKMLTLH
ncbi:MAG: neutral/alkaline non-lysosomal ceramidase N-terminal domain-containing protein, partial [Candidatus Thermoplasmatota archaeon]|nr:neutral/alkaline non-lysosomal ceramidase N-terminal domain-containing protein [Candidatus Thermoplasmatota archaeon]